MRVSLLQRLKPKYSEKLFSDEFKTKYPLTAEDIFKSLKAKEYYTDLTIGEFATMQLHLGDISKFNPSEYFDD